MRKTISLVPLRKAKLVQETVTINRKLIRCNDGARRTKNNDKLLKQMSFLQIPISPYKFRVFNAGHQSAS